MAVHHSSMSGRALLFIMVYMMINTGETTYFYSSSKLNIPSVPTAFQQVGKLTSNLEKDLSEAQTDSFETKKCECGGVDWTTILLTMAMTVLSFWIGQFGMSFAARCPGWINQALIYCGAKKQPEKKKRKMRKRNVAGKFCVFPLKRNKQIVAHIREPLRSKMIHIKEENQVKFNVFYRN